MFGESRSESPRLPSPWQKALATTRNVTVASGSPLQRSSPQPDASRSLSSSRSSRAPSRLSLGSVGPIEQDSVEISPSGSASQSIHTPTSSRLGSGDDDEERPSFFRHSSQNLILSPDEQGMTKLPAERDAVGHIEYKLKLIAPGPERFDRLTTQLKWRLTEGGGEAMYEIGVMDDGTLVGITQAEMQASLRTLDLMASELGATVMVLRTITLTGPPTVSIPLPASSTSLISATPSPAHEDPSAALAEQKRLRKERKRARLIGEAYMNGSHSTHPVSNTPDCFKPTPEGSARRRVYDNVDDLDDAEEPIATEAAHVGLVCPSTTTHSSERPIPTSEEELNNGTSVTESWRERNIQRARHDQQWRSHSYSREPTSTSAPEGDAETRPVRKWQGKRPWRRKKGGHGHGPIDEQVKPENGEVVPLAEDEFLFTLEGLDTEPNGGGEPLTEGALQALNSGSTVSLQHHRSQSKVNKRSRHNPDKRSRRKEERRMQLLRGDGAGEGCQSFLDRDADSSDSEPDFAVKDLLQRMIFSPDISSTETSSPPEAVDLPNMELATSPGGKTMRAHSPRSAQLFSLPGTHTDPTMLPIPSPTDTITQPLDSLSLSFAHSEVVDEQGQHPANGAELSEDTGNGSGPPFERICVEALVIKKMELDEPFGFLDFGNVGSW